MPDKWEQYAEPQKGADKWAQYAEPAPAPPTAGGTPPPLTTPKPDLQKVSLIPGAVSDIGHNLLDFYTGAGRGFASTANNLGKPVFPDVLARKLNMPVPTAQQQQSYFAPKTPAETIGKGAEQVGEFMLPGAGEERLASMAPRALRPVARLGLGALSSGGVNKLQGGDFTTGAVAGGAGSAVGQGLKAVAPSLAESALRVRGNQRLFGRTVGDAILNDTGRAVRPESIGRNAGATIARLTPELDAADQASAARGDVGSLIPARQRVGGIISGHNANRAVNTAAEVQPIANFLDRDALTGLRLAPTQPAPSLRALKRGLNEDYIGKWSLEQPAAQKGAARQAYGALNDELHRISPETAPIDQRISSLVPVRQQGERVATSASIPQRVMGRISAHTGALASGVGIGGAAGYHEGGWPGAFIGGLGGLVVPELMASPEAQMIAARGLYATGNLRPVVGGALQLTRPKKAQTIGTGAQQQ